MAAPTIPPAMEAGMTARFCLPATTIPETSVSGLKIPLKKTLQGYFHPPPTPPLTSKHEMKGLLIHSYPFGLHFDAMEDIFDLPQPPVHRNARWEAPLPLQSTFRHNGGIFNVPPTSLALKHETRFAYLPFSSHFDATGCFRPSPTLT